MQEILQKILYELSRAILEKYKPEIISLTGSMGKTSTKEAIYTVLVAEYGAKLVRRNVKNYNNEIGVPLTIIGVESGNRNILKWAGVIIKAFSLIIFPCAYPKIIVLEMGADKPGDISYLTKLAPGHIGMVTAIGEESPVHIEFFKDKAQLVKEKMTLMQRLQKEDYALINIDDQEISKNIDKVKAKKLTLSLKEEADITALDIQPTAHLAEVFKEKITGLNLKIKYAGNTVPFFLPHALGLPQVYAALFAIGVGVLHEINLVKISEALKDYQPPKGRLNLIAGIKHTLLIDDSYNSSPKACKMALNILSRLPVQGKKYACLGDMAELGGYTEAAHKEVGEEVVNLGIDYLVTVGEKGRLIAHAAVKAGLDPDHAFEFNKAEEAGRFIQDKFKEQDAVLIKGSQSMRMERVTKELMAEPERAQELLVRQDKIWLSK